MVVETHCIVLWHPGDVRRMPGVAVVRPNSTIHSVERVSPIVISLLHGPLQRSMFCNRGGATSKGAFAIGADLTRQSGCAELGTCQQNTL